VSGLIETFGKYILLERLATGGMAEIYLARNAGNSGVSKFFAIKRILPQYTETAEFIEMFKSEAKIAINLAHGNIVSIYEFGMEKDLFFIVMDYIEGRNLRQILNKMKKSDTRFSIEQILFVIKEVAAGLDHAHRCIEANTGKPLNIIHRDMSPQNVMISFEGEVKVVDFGIAKAETALETTRAGTIKGKFGYMSPEQAENQTLDLRTDIFALGIILWELLANDRLFLSNNEANTLRKVRECQIPSLRKINPAIPSELERIVSKALARDRNLRYQTADAFHRDLSRFLNRQFPDFSAQDFSVFIKSLFAQEILESRKKMVEFANITSSYSPSSSPPSSPASPARLDPISDRQPRGLKDQSQEMKLELDASKFDNQKPTAEAQSDKKAKFAGTTASSSSQPLSESEALLFGTSQDSSQKRSLGTKGAISQLGSTATLGREGNGAAGRAGQGKRSVSQGSYSKGSYNQGSYNPRPSRGMSIVSMIMVLALFVGGGAYYYQNRTQVLYQVNQLLTQWGLYGYTGISNSASTESVEENKKKLTYEIRVSSSPSGAWIDIDGKQTGELTPSTLRLEPGRTVTIGLKLPGYLPYSEQIQVSGSRLISATLESSRKGFLNVVVNGNGKIYVGKSLVAERSPASNITVPADQELTVTAWDQTTNASDSVKVTIKDGETRSISLTPKANLRGPPKQLFEVQ
jgi:serine/threonine protein kinase